MGILSSLCSYIRKPIERPSAQDRTGPPSDRTIARGAGASSHRFAWSLKIILKLFSNSFLKLFLENRRKLRNRAPKFFRGKTPGFSTVGRSPPIARTVQTAQKAPVPSRKCPHYIRNHSSVSYSNPFPAHGYLSAVISKGNYFRR